MKMFFLKLLLIFVISGLLTSAIIFIGRTDPYGVIEADAWRNK